MTLDLFNLAGKKAIVTGCDTGPGLAMAIAVAEAGADIIGMSGTGDISVTKQAVAGIGKGFFYYSVDLSAREQVYEFINKVRSGHERIDILVNNGSHADPAVGNTRRL